MAGPEGFRAMSPASARALADDVLVWLAGDPAVLGAFLAATGLAPADLRDRSDDPDLARAVLEHLLADEALLIAACRALGQPFDAPARAALALGGGPGPDWT
jgi:hypothetical protein